MVSAGLGFEGIGGPIHARSRTLSEVRYAIQSFHGLSVSKITFCQGECSPKASVMSALEDVFLYKSFLSPFLGLSYR